MYWLLLYELVEDYIERRGPLRAEHVALATAAHERGELVLAGALDNPADRAVLVFRTENMAIIEEFVHHDPYIANGLIKSWEIRRWNVVIGGEN